ARDARRHPRAGRDRAPRPDRHDAGPRRRAPGTQPAGGRRRPARPPEGAAAYRRMAPHRPPQGRRAGRRPAVMSIHRITSGTTELTTIDYSDETDLYYVVVDDTPVLPDVPLPWDEAQRQAARERAENPDAMVEIVECTDEDLKWAGVRRGSASWPCATIRALDGTEAGQ